ncbi:MAG: 30S ribosomal protein S5 [Candidatus Micrarchaeia archaeon]
MAFNRDRQKRDFRGQRDEPKVVWVPKTELGKRVASGQITSIDEILNNGLKIIEPEIVDVLVPDMQDDLIKLGTTQRVTDSGRKIKFRAVVVVGDGRGHIGIGAGKSDEARPAIDNAVRAAKRNLISVPFGCGSWECGCGTKHSLPIEVSGKSGSVTVTLRPAPRGVGVVGNAIVKKVLAKAGLSDVWSSCRGSTSTKFNTAMAVYNALRKLNNMHSKRDWTEE